MSDKNPTTGENREREHVLSRRTLLGRITVAAGAIAGALASLPVVGFVFGPFTVSEDEEWQSVGPVDDYAVGETVMVTFPDAAPLPWSGQVGENTAWLQRRGEDEFVAYSHFCTHLGCPVFWFADARLFMCPCHGGVFYDNGEVAVEPPQEPLTRFAVRIHDGQVEIRTATPETAG
ncbi:MAG TPA: Rieske (2Fe-2S) protein [Thermomicrobiales bacterium]|nr:Rieske (2Fe-2S) protein [Thermomicrobiales bacterium]